MKKPSVKKTGEIKNAPMPSTYDGMDTPPVPSAPNKIRGGGAATKGLGFYKNG